ncbi:MAG: hypothetical protein ACP5T0_08705 [Verrucomicrobiia bacterium]
MIRRRSDYPDYNKGKKKDHNTEKLLKIEGEIVVELAGKSGSLPDRELITQAISAVVHYIKTDLKIDTISAKDFSTMLEAVLEGFGFNVKTKVKNGSSKLEPKLQTREQKENTTDVVNLQQVAEEVGCGYELFFFDRLRQTVLESMLKSPRVLYLYGLRDCVKHLVGTRKWTPRCQSLCEEIVHFTRSEFQQACNSNTRCALLIR